MQRAVKVTKYNVKLIEFLHGREVDLSDMVEDEDRVYYFIISHHVQELKSFMPAQGFHETYEFEDEETDKLGYVFLKERPFPPDDDVVFVTKSTKSQSPKAPRSPYPA